MANLGKSQNSIQNNFMEMGTAGTGLRLTGTCPSRFYNKPGERPGWGGRTGGTEEARLSANQSLWVGKCVVGIAPRRSKKGMEV